MQEEDEQPELEEYNVVVVGESGAGKTSLLKKVLTDKFERRHIPTKEPAVHPLDLSTTLGPVRFNCIDTPPDDKNTRLRLYRKADAVLLVYDLSKPELVPKVEGWVRELQRHAKQNVPVAICGNKLDAALDRNAHAVAAVIPDRNFKHFLISVKDFQNIDVPITFLARRLFADDSLELTEERGAEEPAGEPPAREHAEIAVGAAGVRAPANSTPAPVTPAGQMGTGTQHAPATATPGSPLFGLGSPFNGTPANGSSAKSKSKQDRLQAAAATPVPLTKLQQAANTPVEDQ